MQITMKMAAAVLLATALAACGGGGGSPGTTTNSGGTSTPTPTPTTTTPTPSSQAAVADFVLFTDKSTITNSGSDSAKVTVVAVDANRNVVAGAPVAVSTDASSFFVPGGTQTDANGTYSGNVQAGGDKTNRDVTVTVTVNGLVKRTTVRVSGSKLTLQSQSGATVAPNALVTMTATLVDAATKPIVDVPVTLGGTFPAVQGLAAGRTDGQGQATVTFTAPTTAGTYVVSATGGGTSSVDFVLQVVSGVINPATIPVGVTPTLSSSSTVLSANSPGSTTNRATIGFQIKNVLNQPIQNVRVRFVDMTTGLPAQSAQLTTAGTMLYTDASGSTSTEYIPGPNSSAINGVVIRACYSGSDFSALACPNFVDLNLTVAGQAVSVSIGDDNLLTKDGQSYVKKFAVMVADSAGRAVAGVPIDIQVDLSHYAKGTFAMPFAGATNALSAVAGLTSRQAYPDFTTDPGTTNRVWCPNEDVNRNNVVDPTGVFPVGGGTENYNGNADVEPRKGDLTINYDTPGVTTTDSRGIVTIRVTYAQSFATWLAYRIRATANVSGTSQGMAERLFITDALQADVTNGAFLVPPYGAGSCAQPN
jgi:hypothetical protein